MARIGGRAGYSMEGVLEFESGHELSIDDGAAV